MKKRFISLILSFIMMIQLCAVLIVPASAASSLSISAPSTDFISKSDFTYVRWNSVSGAVGYRITIVDGNTGELYTSERNLWVGTKTKYSISSILDDISGYPMLKIWVGAMASSNSYTEADVISSDVIWATLAEAPDITNDGSSNITSDGVTLKMTVEKNYGSAIADAGFYIGTSSSKSKAEKYSFDDYGPSGIVNNGTMTMNVTGLESDTKYYYWAYAENGVDETTSSYKTFRTEEDTGSLSLSKSSWNPTWNANSTSVTVACSGSYTVSVDAETGHNIGSGGAVEWLTYSKSGSNLTINVRANYGSTSRSGTVTVRNGNSSKEITVIQGKGAPSPTLQLGISDATNTYANTDWYNDGATYTYGTLNGNDVLYLKVKVNDAVQRIYVDYSASGLHSASGANGWPNPSGCVDDEGFVFTKIEDDVWFSSYNRAINTNPAPGTYSLKVTVSNSPETNAAGEGDDWSIKKTVTLNVKIDQKTSSSDFGDISPAKDYPNLPAISKSASESSTAWTDKNTIVYVQQQYSSADLYDSTIWGSDGGSGKCTRASTSSAFSYLNIKALPKSVGDTIGSGNDSNYCGCDDAFNTCYSEPYGSYAKENQCTVDNLRFCENEMTLNNFIEMYNRYANDTTGKYSPLVFYTNYYNSRDSMHTLLIVGHSAEEDNVFYVLNPGNNSGNLEKIKLKVVDGQVRIEAKTKAGSWSTDHYNVNYTPCQVWQFISNTVSTAECSHNWGEWQDKGSYSIRYCSLCETSETKTNYEGGMVVTQYTISGTITSYGDSDDVTLVLCDGDRNIVDTVTITDDSYSVTVSNGEYILAFSKANHVTREYEVTVNGNSITQNVTICLLGDVTGDGKVTLGDYGKVLSHVKKKSLLSGYTLQCADVTGDGKVTLGDYGKILSHVKKKSLLW